MPCGGQLIKMCCKSQILLHTVAIFMVNAGVKLFPLTPSIGAMVNQIMVLAWLDAALWLCSANSFKLVICCTCIFSMTVGMNPVSISKHTQDEAKRQNQQHFIVVLEQA